MGLGKDLLEYTEKDDLKDMMFSPDFEKTFDAIDHCFSFACLKKHGFGIYSRCLDAV